MQTGEAGLAHVCFEYYEKENIKSCQKHYVRPYIPLTPPLPPPHDTHMTLSGKNPTFLFLLKV